MPDSSIVVPAIQPAAGLSGGSVIWLTGLSGSGKSTIARAAEACLRAQGARVEVLDGDQIRETFCRGLGYSKKDRDENVHRAGYVAGLLARQSVVVFVALISPYRAARNQVREHMEASGTRFLEVFVNAPLETCESRDPKGLYQRARRGEIASFTGLEDPYEPPLAPEVECRTDDESVETCVQNVLRAVKS